LSSKCMGRDYPELVSSYDIQNTTNLSANSGG
jgi:hypothetical protein